MMTKMTDKIVQPYYQSFVFRVSPSTSQFIEVSQLICIQCTVSQHLHEKLFCFCTIRSSTLRILKVSRVSINLSNPVLHTKYLTLRQTGDKTRHTTGILMPVEIPTQIYFPPLQLLMKIIV